MPPQSSVAPTPVATPAADLASHRRRRREEVQPKKTAGEHKTVSPSAPQGSDDNSIKDPFAP